MNLPILGIIEDFRPAPNMEGWRAFALVSNLTYTGPIVMRREGFPGNHAAGWMGHG